MNSETKQYLQAAPRVTRKWHLNTKDGLFSIVHERTSSGKDRFRQGREV